MKNLNVPLNSIIITPNNLKKTLLNKLSNTNLTNTKILTISEVRQKFYFTYNEKTIYYLMDKYGYVIDVAKMYLERLYEVGEESFNSQKISTLFLY